MGQRGTTLSVHLDSRQQEGDNPGRANLDLHAITTYDEPTTHIGNPQQDESDTPKFVFNMELRDVPADEPDAWIRSYGTICCGAETMRAAWPRLKHKFSIRPSVVHQYGPTPDVILQGPRVAHSTLDQWPVDLLVVERGYIRKPRQGLHREEWEHLVSNTTPHQRPKVVVESWPAYAVGWELYIFRDEES